MTKLQQTISDILNNRNLWQIEKEGPDSVMWKALVIRLASVSDENLKNTIDYYKRTDTTNWSVEDYKQLMQRIINEK